MVVMTPQELMWAAQAFGVPTEDVPVYVEAFHDIGRLGVEAFTASLASETDARRRDIRQIVLTEVQDYVTKLALQHYEGPLQ